ncbi:MAG TPA: PaaI family thioesterase [Candidatus Acidoferrales bacterium]|nr:PaaI family thioesterase [Candidatus Acidoferrales bacterium]
MPTPRPQSYKSRVAQLKRELEDRVKKTNVLRFLGVKLVMARPRHVVLRLRVRPHLLQAHRVVHGGVVATLADTAGGLVTYMSVPYGTRVATVEMKINFLEPIARGTVTADARVIRLGRNFSVVDCDVHDSTGKLAGKALMTFAHDASSDPRWRPS